MLFNFEKNVIIIETLYPNWDAYCKITKKIYIQNHCQIIKKWSKKLDMKTKQGGECKNDVKGLFMYKVILAPLLQKYVHILSERVKKSKTGFGYRKWFTIKLIRTETVLLP